MKAQDMVRQFHEAFNLKVRKRPTMPGVSEERWLRYDLQEEEVDELYEAIRKRDLIGVADALADTVYVAYGTALAFGIDLDAVLAEVHRSNMTKLGADGKPIYREDGKVQKGPGFEEPRISRVLFDG